MSRHSAVPAPWAWMPAGALLACGSAVGLVAFVPDGTAATRAGLHVWDAGHALALGVAAAAWAAAMARLGVARWWSTFVLAAVIALLVVPVDLRGPAQRLHASTGVGGWAQLGAVAIAIAVAVCEWLGREAARRRILGIVGVAVGVAIAAGNHALVPQRHPGLHLLLAVAALAGIAGVLQARRFAPSRPMAIAAHALALLSVAVPAPPRVAAQMAGARGCVLFPWLPRSAPSVGPVPASVHGDPWFRPRTDAAAVPPTATLPRSVAPVIVLLSVDALRADALTDPRDAAAIPTMRALADDSMWFTDARATSARTLASLAAVFAGRHFSQLRWRMQWHPRLGATLWPARDDPYWLATQLGGSGIHTINVASVDYLADAFGVVPGFADEVLVSSARDVGPDHEPPWADAAAVIGALVDRLPSARDAPRGALLFAHLLDPHAPYDGGQAHRDTDARARWRAELAVVDGELGRLFAAIDAAGLGERTIVILTADHGESFGAHGSWAHGTSVYDDVLRVPLLVRAPGFAATRVDTPVSLVDLTPTIVDLFGLPAPGVWMGQSLVPALLGEPLVPARPIAFESRPKQGLLRPDGTKVIRDLDFGTVEVFDLVADPGERVNLYDDERHAPWVGEVATFFDAHEFAAPGYETPVR